MNEKQFREDRQLMGRLGATLAICCVLPWAVAARQHFTILFCWEMAADAPAFWWLLASLGGGGLLLFVVAQMKNTLPDRQALVLGGGISLACLGLLYFFFLEVVAAASSISALDMTNLNPMYGLMGFVLLIALSAGARLRLSDPETRLGRLLLGLVAVVLLLLSFWPRDLVDLDAINSLSGLVFARETTSQIPWLHNVELIGVLLEMDPGETISPYGILNILWISALPLFALFALIGLLPARIHQHPESDSEPDSEPDGAEDETVTSVASTKETRSDADGNLPVEPPSALAHDDPERYFAALDRFLDANPDEAVRDTAPPRPGPPLSALATRWWATFYLPISLSLATVSLIQAGILLIAFFALAVGIGTWIATAGRALQLVLTPLDQATSRP